jgi:rubrerythrin
MSRRITEGAEGVDFLAQFVHHTDRRRFLQVAGAVFAASAVACSDEAGSLAGPGPVTPGDPEGAHLTPPEDPNTVVNLGTGDFGVIAFAFALEQLEGAFYTQVVAGSYFAGATDQERNVLNDLRAHEVIHREYLYQVLDANDAEIPGLRVDFSSVDFGSRMSVLQTAQALEDTGVSAYNGAAQLLQTDALINVAGKIVSVEARHAACIRDLLQPLTGFFAGDDIINSQGLDLVRVPAMVLPIAAMFLQTQLDASGLPTPQYVPASPTATVGA